MADETMPYYMMEVDKLLSLAKQRGWEVGLHFEYKNNGFPTCYWLLIHRNGRYVKAEAGNDRKALAECLDYIDGYHLDTTWRSFAPFESSQDIVQKTMTLRFATAAKMATFAKWLAKVN